MSVTSFVVKMEMSCSSLAEIRSPNFSFTRFQSFTKLNGLFLNHLPNVFVKYYLVLGTWSSESLYMIRIGRLTPLKMNFPP